MLEDNHRDGDEEALLFIITQLVDPEVPGDPATFGAMGVTLEVYSGSSQKIV